MFTTVVYFRGQILFAEISYSYTDSDDIECYLIYWLAFLSLVACRMSILVSHKRSLHYRRCLRILDGSKFITVSMKDDGAYKNNQSSFLYILPLQRFFRDKTMLYS